MKNKSLHFTLFMVCILAWGCDDSPVKKNDPKTLPTYIAPDTIIRLFADSAGIGYLHNGMLVLDNIDSAHFVVKEGKHSYQMRNFELSGLFGSYYLTMYGESDKGRKIIFALPAFGDPEGMQPVKPPTAPTMNTCV